MRTYIEESSDAPYEGIASARRDFLRLAALSAAACLAPAMSVMAGPFDTSDFEKIVPTDKKLDPEWVKSLFARGEPTVYRGAELALIGMPIGGICAGQIYLGGDGKLWHWDLFNQSINTDDKHYAHPLKAASPLEQGFGIRVSAGGKAEYRSLDHAGFSDITFRGEYPIGLVEYRDAATPVTASLEAFSPFIPLNTEDSSLPATILRFTVENTGSEKVEAELVGWLENAVCLHTAAPGAGGRQNRVVRQPRIVLLEYSMQAKEPQAGISEQFDFGTMCLGLLDPKPTDVAAATFSLATVSEGALSNTSAATAPVSTTLTGALARKLSLAPGQAAEVRFVLTWHFPNLQLKDNGRFYATRFSSAVKVAEYVADNFNSLCRQTRLWHDTWYDSTLPYWFLDRTFANTSTLATSTCHRFRNGRFYAWEGVGSCEGTCIHVWQYAQAVARLFPDLERDLRRRTDFGLAMNSSNGEIRHRGEKGGFVVDGQAGCILRAYREHLMSTDDRLLKSLWPKIKPAMSRLTQMDAGDGILRGGQANTLDTAWFGKVAWLSSLYVAAARACEEMAKEVGDEEFARQMRNIVDRGSKSIDRDLFNGEYYIQIGDKKHVNAVGSYDGCEIDQIFGQSWAFQVGLGRILDQRNAREALASLWRYNYIPDVGPFRRKNKSGRWFAMPGEGGLIMCSWPRGENARVAGKFDSYLNESMTGFEYQVASHMLWEGMVQEGLAVVRTIHDRYHAFRRNPWNEVECGDHYARAMASYGVFLAACGYEYHGPKGYLAFAPRLTPNNFRAAFTSSEAWGTISQTRNGNVQSNVIAVKWGTVSLKLLAFELPTGAVLNKATVTVNRHPIDATVHQNECRVNVVLGERTRIRLNEDLTVEISM